MNISCQVTRGSRWLLSFTYCSFPLPLQNSEKHKQCRFAFEHHGRYPVFLCREQSPTCIAVCQSLAMDDTWARVDGKMGSPKDSKLFTTDATRGQFFLFQPPPSHIIPLNGLKGEVQFCGQETKGLLVVGTELEAPSALFQPSTKSLLGDGERGSNSLHTHGKENK